jgi:uncharacterized protein YjiS (DUF1127 family)
VIRRNLAMRHGPHDHLIRTAEARRLQAETIAKGVYWVWMSAQRPLERLKNGKPRAQKPRGRASVADAFRRDLLCVAGLGRRLILEPYAQRRQRKIAIAQLKSLDDHLLADIGLARDQIELAVDDMLPRRGTPPLRAGRTKPASRRSPARATAGCVTGGFFTLRRFSPRLSGVSGSVACG